MKDKVRFHVQMPISLKDGIEKIAFDDDKSIGAVIRTACKKYVEQREKEKNEQSKS